MTQIVIDAVLALGIIIAGAVSFFIGRSAGMRGERAAQIDDPLRQRPDDEEPETRRLFKEMKRREF